MFLYLMVCLCLTGIVMSQEQKQGGLQGMLGGGSSAVDHKYQGKKSFEENLKTAGNYFAVAFVVLSILVKTSYVVRFYAAAVKQANLVSNFLSKNFGQSFA